MTTTSDGSCFVRRDSWLLRDALDAGLESVCLQVLQAGLTIGFLAAVGSEDHSEFLISSLTSMWPKVPVVRLPRQSGGLALERPRMWTSEVCHALIAGLESDCGCLLLAGPGVDAVDTYLSGYVEENPYLGESRSYAAALLRKRVHALIDVERIWAPAEVAWYSRARQRTSH